MHAAHRVQLMQINSRIQTEKHERLVAERAGLHAPALLLGGPVEGGAGDAAVVCGAGAGVAGAVGHAQVGDEAGVDGGGDALEV